MSTRNLPGVVVLCGVLAALDAGCALLSKGDTMGLRYFTPERPSDAIRRAEKPAADAGELRLGRIASTSDLDERLVYRDSEDEFGYYTERRWTEAPEHYLRRRLARVLFEERGVRQVVGGAATTLDVEILAFEEVRAPKRAARMQVTMRLHDQRVVRWEETLTVVEPVASTQGDVADATVDALGLALRTLVGRIADRTVSELVVISAASTAPAGSVDLHGAGAPPPTLEKLPSAR
jgi:cholesterol transport system auxiliary component